MVLAVSRLSLALRCLLALFVWIYFQYNSDDNIGRNKGDSDLTPASTWPPQIQLMTALAPRQKKAKLILIRLYHLIQEV